jgi:hypothetical protein
MKKWTPLFARFLFSIVFLQNIAEAQDKFEVQVYESELVPTNHTELDLHTIFVHRGSSTWEGTIAPSDGQIHLAIELTRGILDEFEMGGYLLLAQRPGKSAEFSGFRIRPRATAPAIWGLPVGLSLSLELGFPQLQYEANRVTLEIRPIIDKKFGRWLLAINPLLTFAFNGPDEAEGVGLEPELMVSYDLVSQKVLLQLEYYTALGPVRRLLPIAEQVHVIYPKIDYAISEGFEVNAGVGIGLTEASDALTWAIRVTFNF